MTHPFDHRPVPDSLDDYRGRFLGSMIAAEFTISAIIAEYFEIDDPEKRVLLRSRVVSYLNLRGKIRALGEILDHSKKRPRYPDLVRDLAKLADFRNLIAHEFPGPPMLPLTQYGSVGVETIENGAITFRELGLAEFERELVRLATTREALGQLIAELGISG